MVLIYKVCIEWRWYAWQSSILQVKTELVNTEYRDLSTCCLASRNLHFKVAWMLHCLTICACVWGLLQSFQWCSSVCCNSQSVSSGTVSTKFFQWCSSVPCKYSLGHPEVYQCTLGQSETFQWHSSVHWTNQCTLAQRDRWSQWETAWQCNVFSHWLRPYPQWSLFYTYLVQIQQMKLIVADTLFGIWHRIGILLESYLSIYMLIDITLHVDFLCKRNFQGLYDIISRMSRQKYSEIEKHTSKSIQYIYTLYISL